MTRIFRRARTGRVIAAAVALPLVLPLVLTESATADPGAPPERQLANSVQPPNISRHLQEFQNIANANGGTRAAGTPGYDASRDYVAGRLRSAGYQVTTQQFDFPFFRERSTAVMEQVSPEPKTYKPTPPDGEELGDFATLTYSGSGETTGTVQGVDLVLPPGPEPNSSTSGCEAADFAGFTRGNIALLQRGTCPFGDKARNAQAAGASGVIIFNEGQPGRTDTFAGTLGEPGITVPVVGASFAVGEDLASPANTVVRLKTDTESMIRTTHNVVAETKQGNPDKVVMAGAHLDSVVHGPGINDNGSGSAGLLEVALQMATFQPRNKVRFAWWGAEELGLLGSEHYVANLPEAERNKIALYLNFDMIGSPNFAYKIYDGSEGGPPGSAEIEKTFARYFDFLRIPHVPTPFDGRSDYGPFIAVGIPAGGLFTGAEGIKTPEEQQMFGGQAGQPYDPCYHRPCDTTTNISDRALTVNTGAIAYAVGTYAFSADPPVRKPASRPAPFTAEGPISHR
ncbi:M28 family metallopeptidase [Nocardia transvalensis]|uniref:M28 family metallopeptidase n=1 Tax=Nocardia transvalensis TaxID=37333 RepID=UPI001895E9DD|nr:M28 family metallopeptidase [Nocardia transvalensis]MBF6326994.1 M20/M25/M40 family metallo-hydrolase [Nocardia transvalensis]